MKKIISIFSITFSMILVLIISFVTTKASSDIVNLASPDLNNKEYLGDGVYRIYENNNSYYDYNVYNGKNTIRTNSISGGTIYTFNVPIGTYTITIESNNNEQTFRLRYNGINFYYNQDSGGVKNVYTFDNVNNITIVVYNIGDLTTEFKLQIEQGSTATPYQTPIGALKQHTQLQQNIAYSDGYYVGYEDGHTDGINQGYDVGYDDGYTDGSSDGYEDGFEDALHLNLEIRNYLAFSNLDNITFLGRSQAGSNDRFFGFKIENVDTYINNISFFTNGSFDNYLYLAPINEFSSGVRANITLVTDNGSTMYPFADMGYNEKDSEYTFYNRFPSHVVNEIYVTFLLIDGAVPDFTHFQQYLFDNTSLYINNEYYNDLFITRIKDIYYDNGYTDASLEYENIISDLQIHVDEIYNLAYNNGYDYGHQTGYAVGYNKGSSENVATSGFVGILSSAFVGVSTLLSIELLPNITLGMIVAVPLVFGILFFILGKRKD